ncbi:helix-turn-helix domain-containing protein [Bacteroides sp.]|uniref:helix-turn-helix domain-containing protein n=1 Tax=Bacteroides sp. TaxID=29523 RepID=UPI00396721DF
MEYLFLRRKSTRVTSVRQKALLYRAAGREWTARFSSLSDVRPADSLIYKGILYQLEVRRVFLDSSLSLKKLSVMLETNQTYLSNAVNRYFGCHLKELLNRYRVEYAKELLRCGGCPVGEVPLRSGFGSKSPFYLAFLRETGMTPKRYAARKRNLVDPQIDNKVLL